MTFEPNMRSWAIFARGADAGTNMTFFCPMDAQSPLSAAAAFPVLAVVTTRALASRALTTAIALALSLKDAVGNRPSSFK